jgi:hypothetical protein
MNFLQHQIHTSKIMRKIAEKTGAALITTLIAATVINFATASAAIKTKNTNETNFADKKTEVVGKDSIRTVTERRRNPELRAAERPATPNANSIHINRENTAMTPEQLVKDIFLNSAGAGVCAIDGMISDVTFTGAEWNGTAWSSATNISRSLSFFSNGSVIFSDDVETSPGHTEHFEMEEGLLLTTAGAALMEGPNASDNAMGGGESVTGDPDLGGLGLNIKTGAILEFNFIPQQEHISFQYSFVSEEYSEFANSTYNDVFGFFIWEIDDAGNVIGNKSNIAKLPITHTGDYDVKINNVNWGYREANIAGSWSDENPYTEGTEADYKTSSNNELAYNPNYFKPNYKGDPYMEFDGRTVVLVASADVQPGHKYHLKLAVSNVSDTNLGSGVFLKAGSFDIGTGMVNYGNEIQGMEHLYESCEHNHLDIFVAQNNNQPRTITLTYSGSAAGSIVQQNGSPMPTSITVPGNQSIAVLNYKVLSGVQEGNILITAQVQGCGTPSSINLSVHPKFSSPKVNLIPDCGGTDRGAAFITVTGGFHPQMELDNSGEWQSITIPFTGLTAGSSHSIHVRDSIGCPYDETFSFTIPSCYAIQPENATVQEYQDVTINILANDRLPASILAAPAFNLAEHVAEQPKNGTLLAHGSGASQQIVYRNSGTAALTNNIDSFTYSFTVQNPSPVTPSSQTLTGKVYIYVLSDNNGASACMNEDFEISLDTKPAGVQFSWTAMSGTIVQYTPIRDLKNVTDSVSFLIEPVVPNAATRYNGPFPKGKFTLWPGNRAGFGEMHWTGAVNSDWSNPSNWVQTFGASYVPVKWQPSACVDVVIDNNAEQFPELTNPVSCRNITMTDRAMLKNPHPLTYEKAAVTIQLKPNEMDRYVMWSAPLTGMTSGDYSAGTGDAFMNFFQQAAPGVAGSAAAVNRFTGSVASITAPLPLGQAFNLKVISTGVTGKRPLSFSGNRKFITSGVALGSNRQFSLNVSGGDNSGYTLLQVVNPYMAYLSVDSFIKNNTDLQSGYYIWNGETKSDITAISTIPLTDGNRYVLNTPLSLSSNPNVIPPLQSFFVAKKSGTAHKGTVQMSPDWTTTSPTLPYSLRAGNEKISVLHISVKQGDKTAHAAIIANRNSSDFTDREDLPAMAYEISGETPPLSVYTLNAKKEPLVINSSGTLDMGEVILGLRLKDAGNVTLEFSGLADFGYYVDLFDRTKNQKFRLSAFNNSYSFSVQANSTPKEINDRFTLRMSVIGSRSGNEALRSSSVSAVTTNTGILLRSLNGNLIQRIEIRDVLGRLVHLEDGLDASERAISLPAQRLYIIKVRAGGEEIVERAMTK